MSAHLNARDSEAVLLAHCAAVGRGARRAARSSREASVFVLASDLVDAIFPVEARRLARVGRAYLAAHGEGPTAAGEMVRQGWVLSLPRFREMLTQELREAQGNG